MSKEWETLAEQIRELQRQLVEVTRERDYFKAACEMADALRNQQFMKGKVSIHQNAAGPLVVFEREKA